jgi:hypothetical protein
MSKVTETEEVKEVEESGPPNLPSMLKKLEGHPSDEQIETWKQQYGEVFVSGFSETELFVFRPLSWKEHKDLTKALSTPVEEGEEPKTEFDLQELVVDTCLLWTSVPEFHKKGGTIPTLFEQTMANSNFVAPQIALSFVAKL